MIRRILIFEFITGGGFLQQPLTASLAHEGLQMLNAVVREFADLPDIQLTVLHDARCRLPQFSHNVRLVTVPTTESLYTLLAKLITEVDAVWPIAPETDYILEKISQQVEEKSKTLLNSASTAVALCSDKLKTTQHLKRRGIPVVDAVQLDKFTQDFNPPWVIKTKNGVGCMDCHYVTHPIQLKQLTAQLKQPENYMIQPYIQGESLSLSALFREGNAWLLCCNKQHINIEQRQFKLTSCHTNIIHSKPLIYQQLLTKIAIAIPNLWGYVGIDIMQSESSQSSEPLVLEINPRLTSSYVGIQQALGINIAKLVLDMTEHPPTIHPKINKQIVVLTP